jgi:uncharacterized protein YciI
MFLVGLTRSGPAWRVGAPMEEQVDWPAHAAYMDALVEQGAVVLGGPLPDGHRVVLAMEAASEAELRALLNADPWAGSHLVLDSVEAWTIRLDGRRSAGRTAR